MMAAVKEYHKRRSPYRFIRDIEKADGVAFICFRNGSRKFTYKSFINGFTQDQIDQEKSNYKRQGFDRIQIKPFAYEKSLKPKNDTLNRWLLSWKVDGKIKREVVIAKTRDIAVGMLNKRIYSESEIQAGQKPRINENITLYTIWDKYKRDFKKNPETLRRAEIAMDHLIKLLGERMPVHKINDTVVDKYKEFRALSQNNRRSVKNITVNTELRHLRAIFTFAVKKKFISTNPFAKFEKLNEGTKQIRAFDKMERSEIRNKMIESNDFEMLEIFNFFLITGCRQSELLPPRFTWENIIWDSKPYGILKIFGKGDKIRYIPLNSDTRDILHRRYKEGRAFPFELKADHLYRRFMKYVNAAGIKGANFHSIRKTTGCMLFEQGIEPFEVSKYLGHASFKTTEEHYLDLYPDAFQRLSNKFVDILKNENNHIV